jgi:hypothetical protein
VAVVDRDLSETMSTVYRELQSRRLAGETVESMREYASGLDGALTEEEHRAVDRWIEAEEAEPILRRWRVPELHDRLAVAVIREMRR